MRVFIVIEEYPDYASEINVFSTRAKADAHVESCLKDYVSMGRTVVHENDDDMWTDGDRSSIEIVEKDVE